jgi:lipoprotein signal peptidase
MSDIRRIWTIPAIVMFVLIVLDRVTKAWIDANLGPIEGTSIPVIEPWLRLTYVRNTGVAGIMAGLGNLRSSASMISVES